MVPIGWVSLLFTLSIVFQFVLIAFLLTADIFHFYLTYVRSSFVPITPGNIGRPVFREYRKENIGLK